MYVVDHSTVRVVHASRNQVRESRLGSRRWVLQTCFVNTAYSDLLVVLYRLTLSVRRSSTQVSKGKCVSTVSTRSLSHMHPIVCEVISIGRPSAMNCACMEPVWATSTWWALETLLCSGQLLSVHWNSMIILCCRYYTLCSIKVFLSYQSLSSSYTYFSHHHNTYSHHSTYLFISSLGFLGVWGIWVMGYQSKLDAY